MFHSKTIKQPIYVASLLLISSLMRCSDNTISDGGGTDVFNATISGKITSSDTSSVENSIVKLIPSDFNPLLDIIEEQSIDTLDTTGNFTVAASDSGIFNLYVKSADNSHVSFVQNLIIGNGTDYTLNPTMDSISLQKIILPDNIYGHGAYLGFLGTEIYQGIPNSFDTIEIWLPEDTLPPLQIIWPDGTLGDILIDTFITTDTIIELVNTDLITSTSYTPFNHLGSPSETPIKLLKDSSGNIWTLFKTGITMMKDSGVEIKESNFYDRSVLLLSSSSTTEINDAAFDRNGDLWICSNGEGLFKHNIDENGILGSFQYNATNSSLLNNDTIYTIDFKDSLSLFSLPFGINYGNFEKDSLYESISGYLSVKNAVFISDTGILFIGANKILNIYDFYLKTVSPYPFDFSSSITIASFTALSNTKIYLGTNDIINTSENKVTYFNNITSNWNYYDLYVISPTEEVRSAAIDNDNNEWFGTGNGKIIFLPEKNENKEIVYSKINSSIPSNSYIVNNIIISNDNTLYATFDTLGVALFDINSKGNK